MDKPWVTSKYKNLIRKRQIAFKEGNLSEFRSLRNKVNRMSKSLRKSFYQKNVAKLLNSDSRSWWKHTKRFLNLGCKDNHSLVGMSNLLCNGDNTSLSNKINQFFTSLISEFNPLPPPDPLLDIDETPSHLIIELETVRIKLNQIKCNKAPGPDDLPPWVFKEGAEILSGPLCAIANSSVRNGWVPQEWKQANIVPIPKVLPPKLVESDLRPIALTPIMAKVIESLVGEMIWYQVKDKINLNKFGCCKGVSTVDALIEFLNVCFLATDAGEEKTSNLGLKVTKIHLTSPTSNTPDSTNTHFIS
ncbi:uncharacterized protein [Antedon mediterranea]|uniref:uncharacterized protein n=1 Tax=Antedon mediterranea TaxID=105859 RepID=UPI003AF488B1